MLITKTHILHKHCLLPAACVSLDVKPGERLEYNFPDSFGAKIVHVTPPIFDETKGGHKGYADVLDRYSEWLISQRAHGWDVVDLHFPMKNFLAEQRATNAAFTLSRDGIHPDEFGHWLMAQQILLHLGAKEAAAAKSADELMANFPNGNEVLRRERESMAVWKDAWLTATGHKRPGMKQGAPIEINPQTGEAHFLTQPNPPTEGAKP